MYKQSFCKVYILTNQLNENCSELQITPTRHLLCISDRKKVQQPSKIRKYLSNEHKIGGAHLQCVNNQYAKFENEEIKNCWSYRLRKPDTI